MDKPRILSNSTQSDRLLHTKLQILKRTLRVRGVECLVIQNQNDIRRRVYGINNIDLDGDRADESKYKHVRLVLNLNNLEHVGEKATTDQTVYHTEDFANEGDVVLYCSRMYEYAFKVNRKMTYGELDFLYEYELNHFRTIQVGNREFPKVIYDPKPIDEVFADHQAENSPKEISSEKTDWRDRIKDLDIY